MELFNLDELVTTKRKVHLFGADYAVAERSVGQMIAAIQISQDVETVAPEVVLGKMIDAASQIIPDCPRKNIERLTMKQLQALIKFASESDEETEAASEESHSGK